MPNNVCVHLRDLMAAQRPALMKEIELNKYYLSQKAKQDVGWEAAQQDFIDHYLTTWAAGFKAAYCGCACSDRGQCSLAGNLAMAS